VREKEVRMEKSRPIERERETKKEQVRGGKGGIETKKRYSYSRFIRITVECQYKTQNMYTDTLD